jgi:hypothetical protein
MRFMLTAVAAGAPLYLASAAALALHGRGGLEAVALAALALVTIAHAGLGFLAIGGAAACQPGSTNLALLCALASSVITATMLAIALAAAHLFPLPASGAALPLAGLAAAVGLIGVAAAIRACVRARRTAPAPPSCGTALQ